MITPCLITMRSTRQLDPMLIPYMGRKIVLSFDPLMPDPLTPRNWTIHASVEVLYFVVAVCFVEKETRQVQPGSRQR